MSISIHAPAKGATPAWLYPPSISSNFNPRSREGSDKEDLESYKADLISIHAPAKGATKNNVKSATIN